MSRDRMHRLWRLAKLQVPRKRRRRRAPEPEARPVAARERNHVWAYDFLFDACANGEKLEWFRSRAEAKVLIDAWRCHYNEIRPHSSLDYRTPHEYKAALLRSELES